VSRAPAPIRRRRDFAALAASRDRGRSGPLRVVRVPLEDRIEVGYAVGRSVGPAVDRNRLRRRLRALMRELTRDEALPSGRYLVSVDPAALELTFDQLRHHLRAALAPRP
jgi:ribonuclease P protein component